MLTNSLKSVIIHIIYVGMTRGPFHNKFIHLNHIKEDDYRYKYTYLSLSLAQENQKYNR